MLRKQNTSINLIKQVSSIYEDLLASPADLPLEAFLFFPREFDSGSSPKKDHREVFNGRLSQDERELLASLQLEVNRLNETQHLRIVIPSDWSPDDSLRFIYAENGNVAKALHSIISHLKWTRQVFPLEIGPSAYHLICQSGAFYIFGKDFDFRPNVYVIGKSLMKLLQGDLTSESEFTASIAFLAEYMIKKLMLPGQIERWNIIVDLTRTRQMRIDGRISNIIKVLLRNYKERLNRLIILGLEKFISGQFFAMLNEKVERKAICFDRLSKMLDYLAEHVPVAQREVKYGGSQQNKDVDFFPPRELSLSDRQGYEKFSRGVFISEQEFLRRYDEKELLYEPGDKVVSRIKARRDLALVDRVEIREDNSDVKGLCVEEVTLFTESDLSVNSEDLPTKSLRKLSEISVSRRKSDYFSTGKPIIMSSPQISPISANLVKSESYRNSKRLRFSSFSEDYFSGNLQGEDSFEIKSSLKNRKPNHSKGFEQEKKHSCIAF